MVERRVSVIKKLQALASIVELPMHRPIFKKNTSLLLAIGAEQFNSYDGPA